MISAVETKAQIYEIGYLLTPFLPEEKIPETVDQLIKAAITKAGGEVVSETMPKMIALAYPIAKVLDNKKNVFQDAHFGAVKFEAASEVVPALLKIWQGTAEIVRFLVIKSYKEVPEAQFIKRGEASGESPVPTEPASDPVVATVNPDENKKAIDAVIDREIADLLTPAESHVS